ncbi:PRC-barrel domain-containing protein [Aliishimia ponticola]|nr:PRC-barrel domain-containing protein [Aliishimia ponticola]
MKHVLIASTLLIGTGALADSHSAAETEMEDDSNYSSNLSSTSTQLGETEMADTNAMNYGGMIRTSALTGGDVYTAATTEGYKWDAEVEFSEINPEWNRIGEIKDVVLDSNGQMIGVIAEVGGFLDIGDKHVMLKPAEYAMVQEGDDYDDVVFVTGLSKDALTDREDMTEGMFD